MFVFYLSKPSAFSILSPNGEKIRNRRGNTERRASIDERLWLQLVEMRKVSRSGRFRLEFQGVSSSKANFSTNWTPLKEINFDEIQPLHKHLSVYANVI